MRDRLIKLIEVARSEYYDYSDEIHKIGLTVEESSAEYIADYLLANGVIVPPCKVGEKVYRVVKLLIGEPLIVEGLFFEYTETFEAGMLKKRFYFWAIGEEFSRRMYSIWCDIDDFGKTVFLTREEAEQALKGGVE